MGVATEVRTYAGTPPLAAFASVEGTPIVIDTTTDIPYYVKNLAGVDTVTPFPGGVGTVTHTVGALTVDQVVVGNGAGDVKTLAAGTNTFVLTMVAGIPAWTAAAGGSGSAEPANHSLLGGI